MPRIWSTACAARSRSANLPPGLTRTWPGTWPSRSTSRRRPAIPVTRCRACRSLFVILLLVVIFRSFTLAITTVLPAVLSVSIAGPLVAEAARHGLQVSPIAQLLLIVLVIGAGTDYGLFLVFRVREELRARQHEHRRRAVPGHDGNGAQHARRPCPSAAGRQGRDRPRRSRGSASRSAPRPPPSSPPC